MGTKRIRVFKTNIKPIYLQLTLQFLRMLTDN